MNERDSRCVVPASAVDVASEIIGHVDDLLDVLFLENNLELLFLTALVEFVALFLARVVNGQCDCCLEGCHASHVRDEDEKICGKGIGRAVGLPFLISRPFHSS